MPSDALSRTLVLSVVAVDLVGYSRKSVAEQMSLKDQFNQILLQAIRDIAAADRIILDTGDGVAIGFLGDPEDALYVAMYMHDAINRDSSSSASGGFDAASIRTGINLGPVKLATGVGGHPNIIGDGINVAERIMQFAEPGQLTASRPLVEVMTRMSDHYATLFQFAGVRTDKQVRAHDVYLVGKSPAAFRQAQSGVLARAGKTVADSRAPGAAVASAASPPAAPKPASKPKSTAPATSPPAPPPAPSPSAPVAAPSNGLADFLGDRNRVATTAFALAVTAVILAALLSWRKMSAPAAPPASLAVNTAPAAPVETPAPAVATPTEPAPKIADKAPPSRETAATKPAAPEPKPAAPAAKPDNAAASKTATPPVAPPPIARTVERPPAKAEPVAPPPATRDKPRDPPAEPAARDSARKPAATKPEARILPGSSAPIVPAYQSPADAPRQEAVAPTPAPPAPAAAAPAETTEVVIVSRSAPAYPVEAVRQGISSGTVRARATIDARGNVVGEVNIIESRPIQAFGREARNSMKTWKFNPGAPGRIYEVEISMKQ